MHLFCLIGKASVYIINSTSQIPRNNYGNISFK